MGLYDREWFRSARSEQDEQPASAQNGRQEPKITTKQREPWIKKMPVPPEYAVWAARYELAIRRRTRKTFLLGLFTGAALSLGTLWFSGILSV